jgi:predicted permease
VELAMWLIGLAVLSGRSWRVGWKRLANPPVFAIIGTLALNAVAPRSAIPGVALSAAQMLGQCAIPLGLILIGATVADLLPELRSREHARVIMASCLVRLVVVPALILGLARLIPASIEARQVLVLHAAMPAAVFPIVMARHFGGDAGAALRVVLGTSLVSIFTIPIWLKLGLAFLGAEP